jgi:hypothetical protein
MPIIGANPASSSIPVGKDEPDTDPIYAVVVIQKAFSVSVEILYKAAHPFDKGKTPFKLQAAAIVVEFEIISPHHSESVLLQEIVCLNLSIPEIIFNIGVIFLFGIFGDAVLSLQKESQIIFFETEVHHDPVPAS